MPNPINVAIGRSSARPSQSPIPRVSPRSFFAIGSGLLACAADARSSGGSADDFIQFEELMDIRIRISMSSSNWIKSSAEPPLERASAAHARSPEPMAKKDLGDTRGMGDWLGLALLLPIATFIGFGMGYGLDKLFHTG